MINCKNISIQAHGAFYSMVFFLMHAKVAVNHDWIKIFYTSKSGKLIKKIFTVTPLLFNNVLFHAVAVLFNFGPQQTFYTCSWKQRFGKS